MSQLIDISPGGLLAVAWTGAVVATGLTVVRLWIRITRLRRLFWDDAFHILALVILISCAIAYIPMAPILFRLSRISSGTENLTVHFLMDQVPVFFQYQFAMITLFWTTVWAVKISFLIFYRRFFEGLKNHMIAWWAVLIFALVAYVGCWVSFLTACGTPYNYFHSSLVACELHESVTRTTISVKYSTAVDILSDLMIMALPLRILTALRISIRQKLALAGIFCLGFVIIIFSIVRAVETSSSLTNSWSLKESDPVWLALWSILEASVAVCVSSLPTMRLFFTKTTPSSPGATPRGASNTIGSASSNPLRRIPAPLSSRRNSHARLPSTPPPNRDIIHQPHTATHNDDDTKKRPMSDGAATLTSNWTANISDEKATLAEKARVNSFFHPMSSPISPTSRAPNSPTKYSHREGARSPPGFSPIKGPSGGLEHTAVRELDVPRGSPGTLGMARESPFSSEDTKMERGEMVFEMGENTPPHRGGSIV